MNFAPSPSGADERQGSPFGDAIDAMADAADFAVSHFVACAEVDARLPVRHPRATLVAKAAHIPATLLFFCAVGVWMVTVVALCAIGAVACVAVRILALGAPHR